MNNIFDGIKDQNKDKLLSLLEANIFTFKKNKIILTRLKKENIIGILLEGYLQIIKTDYNGNKINIDDIEPNEVFGTRLSRISSEDTNIITKEDSKVVIIDFNNIINLDINNTYYNKFMKNLLNIMSNKMLIYNERCEILTQKTIRNKLLSYFKILSLKNKSKTLYIPYSYTDLADYIGTDRTAMYRELKHLKEEKIIEINGKKIKLNTYDF